MFISQSEANTLVKNLNEGTNQGAFHWKWTIDDEHVIWSKKHFIGRSYWDGDKNPVTNWCIFGNSLDENGRRIGHKTICWNYRPEKGTRYHTHKINPIRKNEEGVKSYFWNAYSNSSEFDMNYIAEKSMYSKKNIKAVIDAYMTGGAYEALKKVMGINVPLSYSDYGIQDITPEPHYSHNETINLIDDRGHPYQAIDERRIVIKTFIPGHFRRCPNGPKANEMIGKIIGK